MVTVSLLVIGLSQGAGSGQRTLTRRLEQISRGAGPPSKGPLPDYLRGKDPGKLGPFARLLGTSRGMESAALELDRADIPLRVGEYMVLRFAWPQSLLLLTFIADEDDIHSVAHGRGRLLPAPLVRAVAPEGATGEDEHPDGGDAGLGGQLSEVGLRPAAGV